MRFTLSWLKEHLETEASLAEIADKLTMIGLEIEEVVDRSRGLEAFVAARVLEAKPHPNADRLRVCKVDDGSQVFDVVCGAPNARSGMIGVFATAGMYIPGIKVTLKKASIRGAESNGMLLSGDEMGINDDHTGIIELPEGTPIGSPAVEAMGLSDPIIDVAVTPNRGDCLGVRGIARDLAAAGLGRLKPLDDSPVKGAFKSPIAVRRDLDEAHANACPMFVGRYFRGVTNGDSPQWLKDRLVAVGLRPISALVDITNYFTIGLGRPLHVFDADKVKGDIHVRMGRPGEKLAALNGKEYEIDGEMTVIADDEVAEGLGGVIGGEPSGCTETTRNVFLETAWFDPVRTAATGRRLNLQTDARFRFERGVDPAFLVAATELATKMIRELCGGEASELVIAGEEPAWRRLITYRPERTATLGGVTLAEQDQRRILQTIGCEVSGTAEAWSVVPPSWRGDMVGEADVVEEILRLHGYHHIPSVPLTRELTLPGAARTPEQRRASMARRTLASRGLVEAVTMAFVPAAQAELFGGAKESLRLVNPISADLDAVRPSVLPNLVSAAGRNADRGVSDLALFEVGPQYAGDRPEDQALVAAGVRAGKAGPKHWATPARPVDAFDAKADALALLAALGAPVENLQTTADAPAWYHPGRSGALRLGPKAIALFGELHPRIARKLGVKGPVAAFEVFLDALPRPKAKKGAAKPMLVLPAFQPVERDFAFVLDEGIAAEAVVRAVRQAEKQLIAEVRVFDQFAGPSLGEGRKSLAVNVVLQPVEKTLTDAEIEAVAKRVVDAVAKATGGTLRT